MVKQRRTLNYTLTTATKTTKVIIKTFKYMVLESAVNICNTKEEIGND